MNFIHQIINKKVNDITVPELFKYCNQYQIAITSQQAEQVVAIIREKWVDIYNPQERLRLINKIAKISNFETAKKVDTLLQKLI